MAFITDKEVLKRGLIIFRRGDVAHDEFYCRIKIPKEDRYKTIALRTANPQAARDLAFEHDGDIRSCIRNDVPVFTRSFRNVADEYLAVQERRAAVGEISDRRVKTLKNVLHGALDRYVGSTNIDSVREDHWAQYATWRRENGKGRHRAQVSDATIDFEMGAFASLMSFAVTKQYVSAKRRFTKRPKLKTMRRDEFTLEEYRLLHTKARKWVAEATTTQGKWYRTMCYNFVLIMSNTGMRPSEARNLRWRDIAPAKDRDGQELVVLSVQGKGKSRRLVALKSVGDYLERVRKHSNATKPDDPVFTGITGKSVKYLYEDAISKLLDYVGLRIGPNGTPRSTYCFRHTYATFRLSEGVDVYLLAEQMGTSVKMIEQHYGHVNSVKHANRVLVGGGGWTDMLNTLERDDVAEKDEAAKAVASAKARGSSKPRNTKLH